MALIRNDLLDRHPTPFSRNSSCEIPFQKRFLFSFNFFMSCAHLISRLPQCIRNALCHFTQYIQLYHLCIYYPFHNYTTYNSKISTITQISSLELNTISSPMAHTHNYIPYNCDIILIQEVPALTYPFPQKSIHSFHQIQAPNT